MPSRIPLPKWPTLNLERALAGRVCGVDEAGYAPLAGPVVAAAVVLPEGPKPRRLKGLTDSKLLTAAARDRYYDVIRRIADVGVGLATVEEIDTLNIYHADMLAMRRAVNALAAPPDAAIVDGRGKPQVDCTVKPVVKGDRRSLSVAAASVIAKVERDRLMRRLAEDHLGYGWHTNVGYGTDEHYLGLLRQGATEHHRRSFAPIATLFSRDRLDFGEYHFEPVHERPDFARVELLELRHDLVAVFDGGGHHLGHVKHLRGRWTFHATGYTDDSAPVDGAGPCAGCHGEMLPAPAVRAIAEFFAQRLA